MAGWHEVYDKFEFASPEWIDMLRGLIVDGLAGRDISEANFGLRGVHQFAGAPSAGRVGLHRISHPCGERPD